MAIDDWPLAKARMIVLACAPAVAGVADIWYARQRAGGTLPARNFLDYIVLLLAVVGGNSAFRAIDSFPAANPVYAAAASLGLLSAIALVAYKVRSS